MSPETPPAEKNQSTEIYTFLHTYIYIHTHKSLHYIIQLAEYFTAFRFAISSPCRISAAPLPKQRQVLAVSCRIFLLNILNARE